MLFITVLCLNQVMLIGRDSKNPDVDSKDPWPRRGFVRLIGLVQRTPGPDVDSLG